MAIKRIDPKATFRVISQFDDAVVNETPEEMEALKTGIDEKGNPIYGLTRYELYLDTMDESKLKLVEGAKPSYFVIRCMKNAEMAEINQKYLAVDVKAKTLDHINRNMMFLEMFNLGCLGVENDGKIDKCTADDIGYAVAVGMGSVVSLFTSLGKHLKK